MRNSYLTLATLAALATGLAQAEPVSYGIDPAHTFASFEIGHFGTSTNRGRFDKKEGSIQLDRAAKTGKVEVTFDAASINTGFEPFTKHLKSPEIFDVEKNPTFKFVSDKFVFNGDKLSQVQGQLTLMGKTNPVTLTATQFNCYQNPMLKREVCGGDFETTIDRTQWGLNYGVDWGFPKNVHVVIQVEAPRQ